MLAELTHRCPLGCPYCSNPIELDSRTSEPAPSRLRVVYALHRSRSAAPLSTIPALVRARSIVCDAKRSTARSTLSNRTMTRRSDGERRGNANRTRVAHDQDTQTGKNGPLNIDLAAGQP